MDFYSRTELLLGGEAMEKLKNSHVAVFGIGGVGGYVCEALARSGVGTLTLVDNDTVSVTNINRQIIALQSTVGMLKTDAAEARLKDINPDIKIIKKNCFYLPETADEFSLGEYDYIVDAVDTVTAKLSLALNAQTAGTPIISSMGTGNKLDASMLRVSDIFDTRACPLARVMRKECKARGIRALKCVYSEEDALTPLESGETKGTQNRPVPGSTAFVPGAAGLIIAGEVIKDLIK
ncbi:MAG: tRNA threonylcarbamoyladenosine dehydratase [Eubacterium sp.]|nr:tRNA threonylcarbamoyladenosine dehydratase [Eubacterium sp.]